MILLMWEPQARLSTTTALAALVRAAAVLAEGAEGVGSMLAGAAVPQRSVGVVVVEVSALEDMTVHSHSCSQSWGAA